MTSVSPSDRPGSLGQRQFRKTRGEEAARQFTAAAPALQYRARLFPEAAPPSRYQTAPRQWLRPSLRAGRAGEPPSVPSRLSRAADCLLSKLSAIKTERPVAERAASWKTHDASVPGHFCHLCWRNCPLCTAISAAKLVMPVRQNATWTSQSQVPLSEASREHHLMWNWSLREVIGKATCQMVLQTKYPISLRVPPLVTQVTAAPT